MKKKWFPRKQRFCGEIEVLRISLYKQEIEYFTL